MSDAQTTMLHSLRWYMSRRAEHAVPSRCILGDVNNIRLSRALDQDDCVEDAFDWTSEAWTGHVPTTFSCRLLSVETSKFSLFSCQCL